MATAPSRVESRGASIKAALAGGVLTIVFMVLADLIARGLGSVSLAPALSAVACFSAGLAAMRLIPTARAGKPATGSAVAIALFGLAELARLDQTEAGVTFVQMGLFVVTLAVMAFLLALLGARTAILMRQRRAAR